ncbi:MAG TPA: VWA domain-containing protein [Lentimicrobium sp.]|nr:VWA domain-containing protein [Lentimicrobium sp.]
MKLANPEALYLLLLIPAAIAWYWFRGADTRARLQVSGIEAFKAGRKTLRIRLRHSQFILKVLAFSLLVVALARPQSSSSKQNVSVEGIDIVLAMDISGSMLAEDFKPNRLAVAKDVAAEFIRGRISDRIGLVVFSGESFTQCPLTTDHGILLNLLDEIKSGMIEDGTAIGDGLATAVSRLKESEAVSKVIILLTDGENNRGFIDPVSAAEIARVFGLRVYTIGVGTIGMAPYPVQTPFGMQYQQMEVRIDEPLMQQIAEMTNGKYFRATNAGKLRDIYREIDQLEKSKVDVTEFRKKKEEFLPFVLAALVLLLADFILGISIFRKFP